MSFHSFDLPTAEVYTSHEELTSRCAFHSFPLGRSHDSFQWVFGVSFQASITADLAFIIILVYQPLKDWGAVGLAYQWEVSETTRRRDLA